MADISKITLPDNSSYDIKDATARSKLNVLTNNLATCATGRGTAAKVATLANFSLNVGATIAVKFTDTAGTADPTSGNLTLNVNGTGAKNIGFCRNGSKAAFNYNSARYFYNNAIRIFTYDGAYWLCMDWNPDNNTDTKVTSVGNHYTPAQSTVKYASDGTLTDITNSASGIQVVTGVEMDAKGHVTGVTSKALKSTDTKVTVDADLSDTSTNPVQSKVINAALTSIGQRLTEKTNEMFNAITFSSPVDEKSNISDVNAIKHSIKYEYGMIRGDGTRVNFQDIINSYIEYNLADSIKNGLMPSDHYTFIEKYKKIRGSSASYTFTSMQDYITVNNCYGNCNNGLVVLSGWFTSTGSAGNPAIISGSFPSPASSFVCGIIVNIDSPNTNTRLLVRHESDGTSSLQCGGSITAGKYFFIGVYTAERCAYNLPYTL